MVTAAKRIDMTILPPRGRLAVAGRLPRRLRRLRGIGVLAGQAMGDTPDQAERVAAGVLLSSRSEPSLTAPITGPGRRPHMVRPFPILAVLSAYQP